MVSVHWADKYQLFMYYERASLFTLCVTLEFLEKHVKRTRVCGVLSHLHSDFPSRRELGTLPSQPTGSRRLNHDEIISAGQAWEIQSDSQLPNPFVKLSHDYSKRKAKNKRKWRRESRGRRKIGKRQGMREKERERCVYNILHKMYEIYM